MYTDKQVMRVQDRHISIVHDLNHTLQISLYLIIKLRYVSSLM